LPTREPFDGESLLAFLAARAIPGVEEVGGGRYRRTAPFGIFEARPGAAGVSFAPAEAADSCRRLFDLDADPAAVTAVLGADPLLAPLVARRPGLRVPGAFDPFELVVRAIVGQQVSVAGARTVLGRLVAEYGEPLASGEGDAAARAARGALTHHFPTAAAVATADPAAFPFPRTRANALITVAQLAASQELELEALVEIPGIGPWTASYVAMRALGDRDAFPPGDVGIRNALAALGASADDERWRPWRSYAVMHLWRSLDG
jgi:AraC family transcriptional regulator of adaptative response / DNA-3-methyladenine glycosylase II